MIDTEGRARRTRRLPPSIRRRHRNNETRVGGARRRAFPAERARRTHIRSNSIRPRLTCRLSARLFLEGQQQGMKFGGKVSLAGKMNASSERRICSPGFRPPPCRPGCMRPVRSPRTGRNRSISMLSYIGPVAKNDQLTDPVAMRRKVEGIYERVG